MNDIPSECGDVARNCGKPSSINERPASVRQNAISIVAVRVLCLCLVIFAADEVVAADASSFDSAGVEIRYYTGGEGEAVVLLHGFSGSARTAWIASGVFDAIAAAGYRAIAIDHRGHGDSGKPHDADAYGRNMAEDIGRLLDHLGIPRAHIVGYSMGAKVANTFRSLYPWRIRTLTLGGYGWPWDAPAATPAAERERLAAQQLPPGNDVDALVAYRLRGSELVPSAATLRANWVPTLSVVGTEDQAVPRADVASLRETMAMVTARDLPGTHAGPDGLLYKAEFAAAVIEFIQANASRR